jgi:S-DNA-T family DNA segregation ATPase FtsK/SpoIIIE
VIIRKPTAGKQAVLPFKPALPQAPTQAPQDLANYKLPGLDLLDEAEPINPEGQEQRVREKARVLEETLASFNIEGKVEAIDTGPVVTMYELSLAAGIKSSQVAALSKDLARALMSPPVRIIDNIPGKSTMGVEVPNLDRERVRLKELFLLGGDVMAKMNLPMCLGKDASGNPMIEDLTKMPHMLIAGTTGSGKSVCINSIIMTILLTQRPDHVKLILVDPKMVEMQDYKSIPHLMAPIIDDMSKAESILEWATQKMDERYEIMSEANVRNIRDYNKLTREVLIERFNATTEEDKAKLVFHMPYIVIIIDELADLMMTSKEVEDHIVRIAQKARAVGIHLILATQRPEAQVVTGLIKSNMPGRICFQVRSRLDSRIMLDQSGGELLLGQGDMMMLKPTGGGLIRAQGAFVEDREIKDVCKFLKEIAEPEFHPELMQLGTAGGLSEGEEKDPLYNEAVQIMIESGRGSVSLIQRRLNIGYSRASRIIDQLRRTGIVGAYKGSMASEVMITQEQWDAQKAAEGIETNGVGVGDGDPAEEGNTATDAGRGKHAGYAQQYNSKFDPTDEDDGGVPDEMPGEHRL